MGVHGLTTYLRENKRRLGRTRQLERAGTHDSVIAVVVDAWSFIYAAHHGANLPWANGGEYAAFADASKEIIVAWLDVGIKPTFVFDGPSPPAKFATSIARIEKSRVEPSLLYFRTSATGRSQPRFLSDLRVLPPLAYSTFVSTVLSLKERGVECYFADGEGDPYAVELAAYLKGYVAGIDSDFAIMNSDGYEGYIPLDEMTWRYPAADLPVADPDFVQMKPPKGKTFRNRQRTGIHPTSGYEALDLTIFHPDSLAACLKLPPPLLPILGAFVGNDLSSFHRIFFDRRLTLPQRIARTADVLRTFLPESQSGHAKKRLPTSVMELVEAMIAALAQYPVPSDQLSTMMSTLVESILMYSIPSPTGSLSGSRPCMLHDEDSCPLPTGLRRSRKSRHHKSLEMYIDAYRRGALAPEVLDVLASQTMWPITFLENPDLETTSRSIGRPIRMWTYAILNETVGLRADSLILTAAGTANSESIVSDGSSLSGGSSNLGDWTVDEDCPASPSDASSLSFDGLSLADIESREINVKEYCRRGGHVAAQDVLVLPLATLLHGSCLHAPTTSVLTIPETSRLALFYAALQMPAELAASLPRAMLLLSVAVRWAVRTMGQRGVSAERWYRHEAAAFIHACLGEADPDDLMFQELLVPTPRNVQLVAQVLAGWEAAQHLAQVLLLGNMVANQERIFSGRRIQAFLEQRPAALCGDDVFDACWHACSDGLEDLFAQESTRETRKPKKARTASDSRPKSQKTALAGRSMFHVLQHLDDG